MINLSERISHTECDMGFFMKIAIAGTGYVGLSLAVLLSQQNQVTAVDVLPDKVDMINHRQSPIQDAEIEDYLTHKNLNLTATLDAGKAYADADYVVIATPTNYDSEKNFFDTSAVEDVIESVLKVNTNAVIVIKLHVLYTTVGKHHAAGHGTMPHEP